MSASNQAKPEVFVRKASGLVKTASARDVFIYNTNNQNIGVGILFLLMFVPSFYAGADLGKVLVITMLLSIPFSTVYALMSGIMPRSGGDYVFISRIFGPLMGFVSGANWVVWMAVYVGVPAAYLGQYGVAPLSRYLAIQTGSSALVDLSAFLASQIGVILVGTVLIALFTWIFIRGTKVYMRVQLVTFLIGIACLLLVTGVMLTSGGQFAERFNTYIKAAGGPADAYNVVQKTAATTEVEPGVTYAFAGYNNEWTAWAIVQVFYILGFSITSSFIAGEIKDVRRSQVLGMPISIVFTAAVMAVVIFSFLSVVSYEWLGSLGWVGTLNPSALGLTSTPTFAELAAIASGNTVVGVLILASFLFWTYVWLPINFLASTRVLLAWSFDRLLPEKVSEVNPTTHTPVNAILIMAVLGELFMILYATHVISSIVGIFGWVLSFCLTCLAAIVLPYKLKDVFEGSGYNWRIAGIPVLSILGAVSLVCLIYVEYLLWAVPDPTVGVAAVTYPVGGLSIPGWVPQLGVPVLAAIAYLIIQQFQKSRSIDVAAAFREIPPE